jgi:hypothetical protein
MSKPRKIVQESKADERSFRILETKYDIIKPLKTWAVCLDGKIITTTAKRS